MREILHVRVGTPEWEPSPEELETVAQMFVGAQVDPEGGVVVTNAALDVNVSIKKVEEGDDLKLVEIEVTK